MAQAKSAKQYRKLWNSLVTEFTSVLLEAGIPANEWDVMLAPFRTAIETAIERLTLDGTFPPVIETEITCGACTTAIGAHTYDENCRKTPLNVDGDFDAPLNVDGDFATTDTICANHNRFNCGACN